ncbi:MAG TPA: serine/threonine-protein kinase [Kofleriaceae bacterium]|nr:serine/threonine-protein kinase [Kofleriaceae bacterium]
MPAGPGPRDAKSPLSIDALRDEEIERTRTFLRLGWIVAAGTAIAVLVVPGDRRIAAALLASLAVAVAGSAWIYRGLGTTAVYRVRSLHALAFAAIGCGLLGTLYVGAFSAAPLIVALGVLWFCRTEHLASAIAVYLLAAGSHAALAILVIAGAIDDPGFYPVRRACSIEAQITGQLIVQQAYALCFLLARMTRRSSLRAIEQLRRATRLAAQRDAQVAELRCDLDRALQIGGPGRFTGHVVGRWELGAVLGRGAMGEVYDARGTGTGALAAVKLVRRELLGDPRNLDRFLREVRIAGSIDTPHVVKVLDASAPHDPLPFLVMERLHGVTLGEILRAGPLSGDPLLAMVTQIGEALDRACDAGVVHRDLKPHNLFRCGDGPAAAAPAGTWKILDFGIALLGDNSGTLTRGLAIGTPPYMAPEQARGEPVDHRADLYALGAVIYRCLTGRVPFVARDTPALLYAVVHAMPVRPSALAAVSPHVEAFLQIALAKSRDARFASGAELAMALSAAAQGALPDLLVRRARRLGQQLAWTEPDRSDPDRGG